MKKIKPVKPSDAFIKNSNKLSHRARSPQFATGLEMLKKSIDANTPNKQRVRLQYKKDLEFEI